MYRVNEGVVGKGLEDKDEDEDAEDNSDNKVMAMLAEDEYYLEPPRPSVNTRDKGEDEDSDTEDEGDDEEMVMLAEDEYRLEPPRPSVNTRANPNHEENVPQASRTFRLRGGYEEPLKNNPFVVKFPGIAGQSHTVNDIGEMDAATAADTYQDQTNNPFAPFSSKIEWEIARWAKLRGPGSTAFSELMSIEGVSGAHLIEVQ
jgi:hypothetical protein